MPQREASPLHRADVPNGAKQPLARRPCPTLGASTRSLPLSANMNPYLVAAAVLAFVVGLVHSVLGERLIFRRLRTGRVVPTNGGTALREAHVRILWASWHVLTVFGWGMAAVLLWLSFRMLPGGQTAFIQQAIVISMSSGAVLVFIGTRARHPGWVGLLGVAALTWLGTLN